MIASRAVALVYRLGFQTMASQKVVAAINQQNGSLWSFVKSFIRSGAKQRIFKAKSTVHHEIPFAGRLCRHPETSAISYWTQTMSRQLLRRGNVFAFGLVGLSLRDTVDGPSFLSPFEEEENKYNQIKRYFSLRFLERADEQPHQPLEHPLSLKDLSFGRYIGKGCNAAVYEANINRTNEKVAVKMMFNYSVESNSESILREMRAECVPFAGSFADECVYVRPKLPAHPNIVEIKAVFTDLTPLLPEATKEYPVALPPRLNEDLGLGRNRTLFLVMKYYESNLAEYLHTHSPSNDTSLYLLAQLMEGVDFLQSKQIVHRDLKKDNLLMSHCDHQYPKLVISDFGCCHTSLTLYFVEETSRGGNVAHLPPEVLSAKPGLFSSIDYSTCDLWASAAIAYELWGHRDPAVAALARNGAFTRRNPLQLEYIRAAHHAVNVLLARILNSAPNDRPSARVACNLCVLLLLLPQRLLNVMHGLQMNERVKCLTQFMHENEEEITLSKSPLCNLLSMSLASSSLGDIYAALDFLDSAVSH